MSILMPDEEGVDPDKNSPLAGSWERGGKSSEAVGNRARRASSARSGPEREVSDVVFDERTIGLSGLSPRGPVEDVMCPPEV